MLVSLPFMNVSYLSYIKPSTKVVALLFFSLLLLGCDYGSKEATGGG
jgi:hypothetical protein